MKKDDCFLQNTLASAGGEFCWGLGLPVVIESTFLQIFLRNLGASSLVVGLIPTFFFTGVAIFGLLSGYLTGHQKNKRKALIITHIFAALPMSVFGIILFIFGEGSHTLPLFLLLYGFFSMGVGLTLPVWQNYLVKIFSDNKVFTAMSVILFVQSAARLVSSFVILGIVNKYSMAIKSSAVIFIFVSTVFLLGTAVYLCTREVDEENNADQQKQKNIFAHFRHVGKTVFRHKNFLRYLASDLETFASVGIISFYANYAVEYCGITAAFASGLFVACMYAGNLVMYLLLGWFDLCRLKLKFFIGKLCAIAAVLLLLLFQTLPVFFVVSFLLGAARGIRILGFPPAVKRISKVQDATLYFSVAPILVLPFSAGLPVLCGFVLDKLGFLGGLSYRLVFAFFGLVILGASLFLVKTKFPAEPAKTPIGKNI